MEISIQSNGLEMSAAIAGHVRDRLTRALNQHAAAVRDVVVRLRDLNGPKGGMDKQVAVLVKLVHGGELIVRETQGDLYAAVTHAAERVKNAAGRMLRRKRDHHRGAFWRQ